MNKLLQIALTQIKGVGPKGARALLAHYGDLADVFAAKKSHLMKIPGFGEQLASAIVSKNCMAEAEKELRFVEKNNIRILWIEDNAYPARLRRCEDAPLVLYSKGKAPMNDARMVSIVGSRKATAYGRKICDDLITDLVGLNIQIVSGLAYGIDVQAHQQAIKQGIPTIGVLGHGLDRIYPIAHTAVAERMLEEGGLLSEFPSETIPDKINFPARNRIIAGLSDVTIVVEAARQGGALITAEMANSYNRDVCAFPGDIDRPFSAGCNYLIKTNRAHLIRDAADLCYLMNWEQFPKAAATQLSLIPPTLTADQERIFTFIKTKPQISIDELSLFSDWPLSKLAMVLLELEMNGLVQVLPGKMYRIP